MDKRVLVHLQANRKVTGQLRGFDLFLNLVLDDASDETFAGEKTRIGQIVSLLFAIHSHILTHPGCTW